MHGAGAGGPAGQDLGTLGDEAAQLGGVLIVDMLALLGAELADLAALAPRRAGGPGFTIKSHEWFLLFQKWRRARLLRSSPRTGGPPSGGSRRGDA